MEISASKKRKICLADDDDHEEEDDEQKIDKFFALIKNIREARDRLMNGSDLTKGINMEISKRKKKKKVEEEKKQIEVWKPSFQREDFMMDEAAQLKNLQTEEGTKKEEVKEGLDLTLSL